MPVTQYTVHYATGSKIIRRIYATDTDDKDLKAPAPLPGESLLTAQLGTAPEDAVEKATGVRPPSSRCVLVTNGIVNGAISADPALDAVPGATLVLHDKAQDGDTYDGQQFSRKFAVVDAATRAVTAVTTLPIDTATASVGTFLSATGALKVGDIIPIRGAVAVGLTPNGPRFR